MYIIIKVDARVAQLVEHDLAKVGAAGSSPVSRSFHFGGNADKYGISTILCVCKSVDSCRQYLFTAEKEVDQYAMDCPFVLYDIFTTSVI